MMVSMGRKGLRLLILRETRMQNHQVFQDFCALALSALCSRRDLGKEQLDLYSRVRISMN